MSSLITNVFVVILENRAFDHMLGFSGITGTDAATGQTTSIDGLTGSESNSYAGQSYTVSQPAPWTMPVDPGHEFPDALIQLAGPNAQYPSGGPYPPISNSGFVSDYAVSPSSGEGNAPDDFGAIMGCFSSSQLPVLNALANEFVVCDNWFSSLPGPTWPNRFFGHAASSGSLDHSPTTPEISLWETVDGFKFPNGTIYDRLTAANQSFRLYRGGSLAVVGALHKISITDIHPFSDFAGDLAGTYSYPYTYIEPDYGNLSNYEGGTSQHPLDGVTNGEGFLKSVYDTLRASSIWDTSFLIITWDEHGGFYDHVAPPAAVAPGDGASGYSQYGFDFTRYGVRVPAIVVSPLIPQNLIDHRPYDHSSIPATVEALLGLGPLTARDAAANDVLALATLTTPRSTPATLPNPATPPASALAAAALAASERAAQASTAPVTGDLPGFLYVAMRHDLQLSPAKSEAQVKARVSTIRTKADAIRYIDEVTTKIRALA